MARVLIAAGGTGGHLYPALATADELRSRGHAVRFVGGDRIERRLVPQSGFELHELPMRSLPRRPSIDALRSGLALARSLVGVRRLLRDHPADVVLGMGGYPSLAPALASGRVPVVLHEQNATLSLAHRLSLWRARVIALSLPLRDRVRISSVMVGNPLRASVCEVAQDPELRAMHRARTQERFGLDPRRTTVLVVGGSQGAEVLNRSVPRIARSWARDAIQVLHISGERQHDATRTAWKASGEGPPVEVLPYLDAIEDAYAAADVVVCRSGASTVAELAAFGLPSVLVPLPQAPRGAQEANARVLEAAGAATVVVQGDGFEERLGGCVGSLLDDPERRRRWGAAAAELGRTDAAARLADVVEQAMDPG